MKNILQGSQSDKAFKDAVTIAGVIDRCTILLFSNYRDETAKGEAKVRERI
jgi:hypothetical protein